MNDKMKKKAVAVQLAVMAAIVGAGALIGCEGLGVLIGIGWLCASSDELSRASKGEGAARVLWRRRERSEVAPPRSATKYRTKSIAMNDGEVHKQESKRHGRIYTAT